MPKFSVILATRDRPKLFGEALDSIIAQTFQDFEVFVVNDGSSPHHEAEYELAYSAAAKKIGDRLHIRRLVRRPNGHGKSYAINSCIDDLSGDFICFLDDDDVWTDPAHLGRVVVATDLHPDSDIYMSNQRAFWHEQQMDGPIWLEALEPELLARRAQADSSGSFNVSIADLIQTAGFCHMNCLIVRCIHFKTIGGMDESIRWEEDRDLYLRLIDNARGMLYNPAFIARHNVPDRTKTQNMSTAVSMLEKRLLQVRVLDKAALFAKHPKIRNHAREHKAYTLKKIAQELSVKGDWQTAAFYAKQALAASFSFKWFFFTIYCILRKAALAARNT